MTVLQVFVIVVSMYKAQKYRFYPTKDQQVLLAQTFGCVRVAYNYLLHYRTEEFYKKQHKVGYNDSSKKLTELKKQEEYSWLNEVSSVPLQQAARNLQTAFVKFWKHGAKYPRFKKKSSKQSAVFASSAFQYKDGKIYLAKSKTPLKIRWSKDLPSEPSTVIVSKDPSDRYFISIRCEFEPNLLRENKKSIGVDLGIKDIIVTSTGFKSGNPKLTKKYQGVLKHQQQILAKKKKGSSNFHKQRIKVARVHAKIADTRLDFTHKLTTKLIRENQTICVEDLSVKNMVKNRKLSKSISDANWGELVRQLEYKALWYGRELIRIDKWFPSSKKCSNKRCGHILDKLDLSVRKWACPKCNQEHDRDINASRNILAAGMAVSACGVT